ncbi:M67 family metallopeptidase [bacterium]|nr:M67 family metallopeptidase [bacterium]
MTTTPDRLLIPRPLAVKLMHTAQLSPTAEVCGLMSAKDGIPYALYPIDNVADDPTQRFELDAQQHIDAQRSIREAGETLLAVYHSHPTAPAEPSDLDWDGLGVPEALLLIVSLNTKGVLQTRGWRATDSGFEEVTLTVID